MNFKKKIVDNLVQIPGWKTKRKIVVIESDDWGSIRTPSKDTLASLENKGVNFEKDLYNKFDSLASENDLTNLFEVLESVSDKNNNSAVITANTVVANPDFNKIKESEFKKYYFEIFTETLKKYPEHNNSFKLWKDGISNNVFFPQFHGRDHVNVTKWLVDLQFNKKITITAFENRMFGLKEMLDSDFRSGYMRALDYSTTGELNIKKKIIIEGLDIFENIFNYKSKSFIAPSYVWSSEIESVLNQYDVKYLQGIRYQYEPVIGEKNLKRRMHFTGNKNKQNQIYLVRNVFFEPTLLGKNNAVENALNRIGLAFKWNNPVILSAHRINFIGYLNKKNRDENLKLFKNLLQKIVILWPDVEFMNSSQLGDIINKY